MMTSNEMNLSVYRISVIDCVEPTYDRSGPARRSMWLGLSASGNYVGARMRKLRYWFLQIQTTSTRNLHANSEHVLWIR